MSQLPPGALPTAIAVLIYALVCLFSNVLMLWLVWTSRQSFSYIGCICIATLICVTANIGQQIYDNLYWVQVMNQRYLHIKSDPNNPMTSYSSGLSGAEFYFWLIRVTAENIAASLGCVWALSLAQAVYGFANNADWLVINRWGKAVAIVLPLANVILILTPWVQGSFVGFTILVAIPYFGSIAGGAAGLLLILTKYIKTRRELKKWEVATHVDGRTTWRSFRLADDDTGGTPSVAHSTGIYDNWLITRFSIAFAFLCIFEMDSIVIALTNRNTVLAQALDSAPNLSASHARAVFALFIPSAFASLLTLFTFGTTRHCRSIIYRTFVPRPWQKQVDTESTGVEPRPTILSAGGTMSSDGGDLGVRFADRGSWAAGVRLSGSIALQELGSSRESASDRISVASSKSSVAGAGRNWPLASLNEVHEPPPPAVTRETTYPI
ncbi:hypothetical protein BD289DRAFT_196596 [Coniella lustricola]|uniref:Uncharacterized protein n=1 Tax=Coniella lustricola TaxID=2025994 RepID=A0A2T3ACR3_9PEZI|nr:hypothetical protein BD289DRAFT_196596 [Coniella lustricola]